MKIHQNLLFLLLTGLFFLYQPVKGFSEIKENKQPHYSVVHHLQPADNIPLGQLEEQDISHCNSNNSYSQFKYITNDISLVPAGIFFQISRDKQTVFLSRNTTALFLKNRQLLI